MVSLPFKFLGIPIGINHRHHTSWEPVINLFWKKLSIWKGSDKVMDSDEEVLEKSNSPISPITRAKAKRTDGVFSFFEVENNNRLGYIVKIRRNIKKKVLKCPWVKLFWARIETF